MNVHNLMEELVFNEVNDLFEKARANHAPWLTCSCSQCRLDTICYVLNRIPPRYIKSGRGLAYSWTEDNIDKSQLAADISRISLEGMKQVLSSKRPHAIVTGDLPDTPVYNFPTFVGRVLNGLTFEPVHDISVALMHESKFAESIDMAWDNPYRISSHTPGTFTFWVKPISAAQEGDKKVFPFEIRIEEKGYDTIEYYFELGITSESVIRTAYNADHAYILPDLHLFPLHDPLEEMQS